MLLLGLDIGTSSVKASVVDAQTQQLIASATYPETEREIITQQPGWAEQDPEQWWADAQQAIVKCNASKKYNPQDIAAIGIAYQMHGLVLVDDVQKSMRNAIIWCDSRAIPFGDAAFSHIGKDECLQHCLNSPGNFTAAKLAWVKQSEPQVYERIYKIMLPGDFIAMKFTGSITTTPSALSEGIFWDFLNNEISSDILNYFGFSGDIIPQVQHVFSCHGLLQKNIAEKLSLKANIPVAYKAGDQPNNALALHVMQPGEVAATAGTSGVIYGISDELTYDVQSRINSFAHVNHTPDNKRIGVLLCINGTGIFNKWIKNIIGAKTSYNDLNNMARQAAPGCEGLLALPFGNGAERMLNNKIIGAQFHHLNFNIHHTTHMLRAVQEGIAYSFRYGLDIMRENKMNPSLVKASKTNLFLSDVFAQTFSNVNNTTIEFYEGDGSYGAAIGAGIGAGIFTDALEAGQYRKAISYIEPKHTAQYEEQYQQWKTVLVKAVENHQ